MAFWSYVVREAGHDGSRKPKSASDIAMIPK